MKISVYGPDYKQHVVDYNESDRLESESYKLISTLFELKQKSRLPGELASFYDELPLPRVFEGRMPWVEKKGLFNRVWKNAAYSAAGNTIFIHDKLPEYAKSALLLKEMVRYFYKVNDEDALVISSKISEKLISITREHGVTAVDLEMINAYLESEMRMSSLK